MDKAQAYYNKMTKTPVMKLVIMLGIPTTISMLVTNIYNMADTYFVGSLGKSQQGAIGILFTLQCIIQAFSFMIGDGASAYLSLKLGEKKKEDAAKGVANGILFGAIISFIFFFY